MALFWHVKAAGIAILNDCSSGGMIWAVVVKVLPKDTCQDDNKADKRQRAGFAK